MVFSLNDFLILVYTALVDCQVISALENIATDYQESKKS